MKYETKLMVLINFLKFIVYLTFQQRYFFKIELIFFKVKCLMAVQHAAFYEGFSTHE